MNNFQSIIHSQYPQINGILVVQKGNILLEHYYNGYGSHDKFHVASVTKSILNALIGIAMDKGYLKSVEQKVLDFFPDYVSPDNAVDKNNITLRHLLTMTAPYPFEDWQEPLAELCQQSDWVTYTLDRLGEGGTLGQFKYATAGAHLLSAILTQATGKCARAFANEYLFSPLGIETIPDHDLKIFDYSNLFGEKLKGWAKDPSGYTTGGWGITLTLQEMARFGSLYVNSGIWNGKEIISTAWIQESTTMHEGNNDFMHYKYGYLWWLHQDQLFAYSAIGDGGNIICCIPEINLVVSIASQIIPQPLDFWHLIKEYILPH